MFLKNKFGDLLFAIAVTSMALAAVPTVASGQTKSLWEQRDERKAFLYRDLKARTIGDILTIAISENTDVANTDSRGFKKSTTNSANGGFSYSGSGAGGSASVQANSNSARDFTGDVSFSSDRRFQDRFSVTIIDVLPNGNLVVQGSRTVLIEGDQRELRVSGIVRGDDIRDDNSVRSSGVAGMRIEYQGQGREQHFTKQGWLGRQVNKLWPF